MKLAHCNVSCDKEIIKLDEDIIFSGPSFFEYSLKIDLIKQGKCQEWVCLISVYVSKSSGGHVNFIMRAPHWR